MNKAVSKLLIFCFLIFMQIIFSQKSINEEIIYEHVNNCSKKVYYKAYMNDYQACLDAGLKKDSTIAYLWQQKAMPYFKVSKYEVGMKYLDKAVFYDKKRWLSYKGFINCIFVKNYQQAILNFEEAIALVGNNYEMDHPYDFYIALSHLQLNNFTLAEEMLKTIIDRQIKEKGFTHHLVLFYYGISKYEQQKWQEAIDAFDLALNEFKNFSDVKFYKAFALAKLGKYENVNQLLEESKQDYKNGYGINEDNAIYETYPYQKKW
jgi:tetratricopeptide (TPR) repeat protein